MLEPTATREILVGDGLLRCRVVFLLDEVISTFFECLDVLCPNFFFLVLVGDVNSGGLLLANIRLTQNAFPNLSLIPRR